ncbi:hypothetical protein ACEPAI_10010 [Sanghuangporus weigelae]
MRIGKLQTRDSQVKVEQACILCDSCINGIQYSTGWDFNQHVNQNETSHSTGIPGSNMFVTFQGTQVNVTGTFPAGEAPLAANYIVDNGQTFMAPVPSASQDVIHQTLFASPILQDGPHNLTVQVFQTGLGRNYTFQNFRVLTSSGGGASADSNPISTAPKGQPNDSQNTAAIVGGILGAIIFSLLAVLLSFCFWKKKRASAIISSDERRLPPAMYYGRPLSDGFLKECDMYWCDSASVIDTNSKFTFAVHKHTANQSSPSWMSVNLPPSVPQSALISPRTVPDWSTYKGSSVINQETRTFRTTDREISDWPSYKGSSVVYPQKQPERSHFSPYTSRTLSSIAFREPTPRVPIRGDLSPSKDDSRSSLSALPAPFDRRMF